MVALDACKTCLFCEVAMTLEALNDQCQQNKSSKVEVSSKYAHFDVEVAFKGSYSII